MKAALKRPTNKRMAPGKPMARSRITNGSALVPRVDGRTSWVRRLRDLISLHLSDIGGEQLATEAEKSLIRRASCLTVELEQMERAFAEGDGATLAQLETYQRASNSLRRLLETIGVNRRTVDVIPTLEQYLAGREQDREPA